MQIKSRVSPLASRKTLPVPAKIFEKIEACPPLMREHAKAEFIGRQVNWTLKFADGYETQAGYARLMLQIEPQKLKFVSADVMLNDYPWLKSMQPGEDIHVRGCIAGFGMLSIELKDAKLLQPLTIHG